MKRGIFVFTLLCILVMLFLVFFPTRLFSRHFESTFDREKFYCGGRDIEVSTLPGGEGLIVFSSETEDGGATFKEVAVQLQYIGSAMFSDYYEAKTGEGAEYDGELKLTGFDNAVGGTCY